MNISLECGFQIQQFASTLYDIDFSFSNNQNTPPLFNTDAMGPSMTDWAPFDHYFTYPITWSGYIEKMDITQGVAFEYSLPLYTNEMDYG